MKVVVAHNYYQQRGGEDVVVESETALLRDAGHDVETLFRNNDELAEMGPASAAMQTFWSRRTAEETKELLHRFKPDVVHVHNTFPLISPSLYWACAEMQVPVVQTLHNFRLACPQAMFLRDGRVCEDCLGRIPLPAVQHGCYRGSRAQTAVLAGMLTLHRGIGTWQRKVARFIALNEFCRQKFIAAGLPADRIVVKPNFTAPVPCTKADEPRGPQFLFVGRLSPEKGIASLEAAIAQSPGVQLHVVGRGPEAARLASLGSCKLLGELPRAGVVEAMQSATALVVPSIWYETFGLVVIEAFANGLPVIASRMGALAELVDDGKTGLLFRGGDAADLAQKLAWAQGHPDEMAQMGKAARECYEARFTPATNLAQLLSIYAEAIDDRRNPQQS